MKMLSATVVDGHLDLPRELLEEGATVTVILPEEEERRELTQEQHRELAKAIDEADRGEGVDGWKLLEEIPGD